MKKILCFCVLFLMIIPGNADYKDTSELQSSLLPEEKELIGDITPENADAESGFSSLVKKGFELFKTALRNSCGSGFKIIACSVIIAIAEKFSQDNQIVKKCASFAGVLAVYLICFSGKNNIFSQCSEAVFRLDAFSKILTPTYALAAAVAKHPASAVATASSTLIFSNIICLLTQKLVFPAISLYAAISAVSAISEQSVFSKICELIKWGIGLLYKILLICFTCFISMTGIVASTTDALTMKTAKSVISGMIPIVGSAVADASDAIISGAAILKSGIGLFGFLGVCAITLVPFVGVFTHYLIFKVTAAFSSSFSDGAISKAADNAARAYSLCLASLGAVCAVNYISVVITSAVTNV